MDETFKKWAALGKDAQIIAKALFQASEGKISKLNSRNWNDETSVWEKALKLIFPGQTNSQRDRFFLWSFWIQERKGVLVSMLSSLLFNSIKIYCNLFTDYIKNVFAVSIQIFRALMR